MSALPKSAPAEAVTVPLPLETRSPETLIRLYWDEIWNRGNVALIREICADPVVRHDPGSVTPLSHDVYEVAPVGNGTAASTWRVRFGYNGMAQGLPESVVVKLPRPDHLDGLAAAARRIQRSVRSEVAAA